MVNKEKKEIGRKTSKHSSVQWENDTFHVIDVAYFVLRQKEQMMKKNEGKTVNQLYLFHGTDESLVEPICEQNFDWRMCGVHGTVYGKGMVEQFQQFQ